MTEQRYFWRVEDPRSIALVHRPHHGAWLYHCHRHLDSAGDETLHEVAKAHDRAAGAAGMLDEEDAANTHYSKASAWLECQMSVTALEDRRVIQETSKKVTLLLKEQRHLIPSRGCRGFSEHLSHD